MKENARRYANPDKENDKVNLLKNNKVNFRVNLDDKKFDKSAGSLEKAKESHIDKNVTECQQQEFVACYEENCYHVVKDICVDKKLSHGEKIKCDKEHHELLLCCPIIINGDKHDDMINDNIDAQFTDKIKLFVESNFSNSIENCGPENAMQNGEEKLDSVCNSLNNPIKIPEPSNDGINNVDQQVQSVRSEAKEQRITSQTIDISNEMKTEENTGPLEQPPKAQIVTNHHNIASDNITVAARGGGESSFSMAGSVLGLITYSGPATSSGSISHRSDGSNSSVRSFAFPILQNEWNSSPVRMAKVDQVQSPKHRGWRQTFKCCRF